MLTEEFGVGFDQMIPLLFERGMRMLAAIYAVLMAGGAYVPLEPHYPSARILGILEQAGGAQNADDGGGDDDGKSANTSGAFPGGSSSSQIRS